METEDVPEKEITHITVQLEIENKRYQFIAESDASYHDCLKALAQFTRYIIVSEEKELGRLNNIIPEDKQEQEG